MLLTLGLVDGVSVRFVYSSLTFVPFWLAALRNLKLDDLGMRTLEAEFTSPLLSDDIVIN
ncbi:hypothetical protein pdam_00023246 [Pocillopora damicornis]|uniref:Uncharacterized protein n=1 Tax=Pocillopora damicornis TaxID=46731 RepID=A0A3M6ULS8_POCDA|nr:hypothetical protein pdam_00023246 [Pocillopora damicornis]